MARFRAAAAYYLFSTHRHGYGIHSPFAYKLIRQVFIDKTVYKAYETMSEARKDYLKSRERISVTDIGAGHHKGKKKSSRRICAIVRQSAGKPKSHRLLFRLVRFFQPATVLEAGTSLGLGTLALALGNTNTQVFTIEGDPSSASLARRLFKKQGLHNITVFTGSFQEMVPVVFTYANTLDFVFLDGHHEEKATLHYFEMILPHLHKKSVMVFDDIHWSRGMEKAWNTIRNHPHVSLSLDLFRMGLVFFDSGLSQQSMRIRF